MFIRKVGDALAINYRELHRFILQKRVPWEEKVFVAEEIKTASEILIAEYGHFAKVGNLNTRVLQANFESFSLLYTTPFNKIIGEQYCLDIWSEGGSQKGKVCSIQWEPLNIISFNRGPWIQKVLESAYHKIIVE